MLMLDSALGMKPGDVAKAKAEPKDCCLNRVPKRDYMYSYVYVHIHFLGQQIHSCSESKCTGLPKII